MKGNTLERHKIMKQSTPPRFHPSKESSYLRQQYLNAKQRRERYEKKAMAIEGGMAILEAKEQEEDEAFNAYQEQMTLDALTLI